MTKLRNELSLFFIAMGFFTRIPMPTWIEVDNVSLNKANRYFALVGVLVGIISAIVYALSIQILPISISILFAMFSSIIVTGAFHEDGLADTADGFGGGWTIADKLRIMKDSNIGTYGAVTLILTLVLKFTVLFELAKISESLVIPALILAHCLSRLVSASIIFTDNYVSESETSKSKSLAKKQSL
ncbi:MAG: adenosylcobinamide-GDP ribazoletransferase, partial [Psychromonas sp.]|nr:adenosylcobinamide-GDP ribazoletransferase [Psychromonas sp.]